MQKVPWMDKLKIGDKVIVTERGTTTNVSTVKIVTGISRKSVYADEQRFSKWDAGYGRLKEYTDENLKMIEQEREDKLQYIESQVENRSKYEKLSDLGVHYAYEKFKYEEWERNFDAKYNPK